MSNEQDSQGGPAKPTPDKEKAKRELEGAKAEYKELGGWASFKNGEWFLRLTRKAFRAYYANANAEYFKAKYPGMTNDQIAERLISVSARYAGLYGVVTGAIVSTDEIVAIVTAGEGGVGLPANVAIAVVGVCAEAICLARVHLQLVANLAKLTGVPLDPDDPEDILIILAYAVGGGAAEEAGKLGMKVGRAGAKTLIRKYISKEVLESLKSLGRKIGVKILQRSILKYSVPLVSIVVGGGWNYITTKAVGKIALKHFKHRLDDRKP